MNKKCHLMETSANVGELASTLRVEYKLDSVMNVTFQMFNNYKGTNGLYCSKTS